MSYRIKRKEAFADASRRLVLEESLAAATRLRGACDASERGAAIHDARKRFKKVRAVLRLGKRALGESYQEDNRWYRDLGRQLAPYRDAEVLIATYDEVAAAPGLGIDALTLAEVRSRLATRRERILHGSPSAEEACARVADALGEAPQRVARWSWAGREDCYPGKDLQRIYRRGRDAMAEARARPTPEGFHAWRKRVKDHWYHARLLRRAWPGVLDGYVDLVKELSDLLGDEHDFSVLRGVIREEPGHFGEPPDRQLLLAASARLREARRTRAITVGASVYRTRPKRTRRHFGDAWRRWRG